MSKHIGEAGIRAIGAYIRQQVSASGTVRNYIGTLNETVKKAIINVADAPDLDGTVTMRLQSAQNSHTYWLKMISESIGMMTHDADQSVYVVYFENTSGVSEGGQTAYTYKKMTELLYGDDLDAHIDDRIFCEELLNYVSDTAESKAAAALTSAKAYTSSAVSPLAQVAHKSYQGNLNTTAKTITISQANVPELSDRVVIGRSNGQEGYVLKMITARMGLLSQFPSQKLYVVTFDTTVGASSGGQTVFTYKDMSELPYGEALEEEYSEDEIAEVLSEISASSVAGASLAESDASDNINEEEEI